MQHSRDKIRCCAALKESAPFAHPRATPAGNYETTKMSAAEHRAFAENSQSLMALRSCFRALHTAGRKPSPRGAGRDRLDPAEMLCGTP